MERELSKNHSERKRRILVLTPCYIPSIVGAGPLRSIEGIVHHLNKEFEFKIITRDRDFGDSKPFDTVAVDKWQKVGEADVFYASPAITAPRALRRLLKEVDCDFWYLNSFFFPQLSIIPLMLRRFSLVKRHPVILAPRGEFFPGGIQLKYAKKRGFLLLAKLLGLHKDVVWHASNELEARNIRNWFPQRDRNGGCMRIATDLCLPKESKIGQRGIKKTKGSLKIIFLSRISPHKNLDYALDVVSRLNRKVLFDIYGPVDVLKDSSYWTYCQQLMEKMPPSVTVNYKGVIDLRDVGNVFTKYDVFLFPTRSENFSHVIAESLSAGCPVLVSDQTPWRNLKESCAGWDLSLDQPSAFVDVLEKLFEMDGDEHEKYVEGTRWLAKETVNSREAIQQNRALFSYVASLCH